MPVYTGDGMQLVPKCECGMAYIDTICSSIYSDRMQEAIAKFLRNRRKAEGKTQVQVAEEAFDDARRQGYISVLERGEALPDIPTLLKLGKSLQFSLSDIEDAVSSSPDTQEVKST